MSIIRYGAIACLLTSSALTMAAPQTSSTWPPAVEKNVPANAPPLSPANALKTFTLPPGYHIELVASEPLVQDPLFMTWDPDGRLWVVEVPAYMRDIRFTGQYDPTGRIVVLEDTNDDGKMDKRTVFADHLVLPRALAVLDHGVLVGEPPDVWLMRDTNHDLHADTKERVAAPYGIQRGNFEHMANGLFWGMDNWIHTANSDLILRWKKDAFEVRKTLVRGQWGVSQDDMGRIYRNTNSSALYVDLVPTPYFARNPNLIRTRGSYEWVGDDTNALNTIWPIRPNPGTNRSYTYGTLREDGTIVSFTAVCAPMIYRGDRLPVDAQGDAFIVEPSANVVSRIKIADTGATLRGRKAYDRGEFVVSTDERFRPIGLSNGPDGTLFILDMYRGIIQQSLDISEYLRDYIFEHKLEQPTEYGRIYRVVHDSTRRDRRPTLSRASTPQLVAALSHPNGWYRDTAQQLLVERNDAAAVPTLRKLATSGADARYRLHALWALDGMDRVEQADAIAALKDSSRDVRTAALRISERWLGQPGNPMPAAVLNLLGDPDWQVREQLAASVGSLPTGAREEAIISVLERYGDNPIAVDAALSGLRGDETTVLDKLLQASVQNVQREAAITMLAAMVFRASRDVDVQGLLAKIADANRPAWQQAALLRGAEVAVLGTPPPGTPAGRRGGGAAAAADAPCATCPGARGGPGSADAFPDIAAAAQAAFNAAVAEGRAGGTTGPQGRGGGGPWLVVSREPAAFSALASRPGDLTPRVNALLTRIVWPGKPGANLPPPLSAAEEERFMVGHQVYSNYCQVCHQADGRGQDNVAPSLVGSRFAIGPAAVPARILLAGKEGFVGLMPPIGSAMTDDQIAAALTYIRREWGQAASAVDPALVADVRRLTATRTKPWTDAELSALLAAN